MVHLLHLAQSWPMRRELRVHLTDYLSSAPRPTGNRVTTTPGPDPVRVLLVGSGLAVGYGVTSRTDALDGHLGRALAARTGRGVQVTNHADPERSLMEQVFEAGFTTAVDAFELVVWCPSTLDVCTRRIPGGWATRIDGLARLLEPGTRVVVTGLAVTQDPSPEAAPASRLAEELNADLVRAARGVAGVSIVDVPAVSLQSYGHPRLAGEYFAELAARVAAAHADRPLTRV